MLVLRGMKARETLGMFYTVVLRDRGEDAWILKGPMQTSWRSIKDGLPASTAAKVPAE